MFKRIVAIVTSSAVVVPSVIALVVALSLAFQTEKAEAYTTYPVTVDSCQFAVIYKGKEKNAFYYSMCGLINPYPFTWPNVCDSVNLQIIRRSDGVDVRPALAAPYCS